MVNSISDLDLTEEAKNKIRGQNTPRIVGLNGGE